MRKLIVCSADIEFRAVCIYSDPRSRKGDQKAEDQSTAVREEKQQSQGVGNKQFYGMNQVVNQRQKRIMSPWDSNRHTASDIKYKEDVHW
jgi:hypothetical protein